MMIAVERIQKWYDNGTNRLQVLSDVSLNIAAGELVALVGASGAGKSTLLHIMGGLDQPDSGRIMIDGIDVVALSDRERSRLRRRYIGFVFQFYHLLPEFNAVENVMLAGRINGLSAQTARERSQQLLRRVGLSERLTHRPQELSGGEQQRVAIARALINQPRILLCDEPTGNLDSRNGACITDLLRELNQDHAYTIVLVTHSADVAAMASKIYVMRDGALAA